MAAKSKSNSKRQLENWNNDTHNIQQAKDWSHTKALKAGEKGPWTDAEDSKLTMLVSKHGLVYWTWSEIEKEMPGECSFPHVGICFGVANLTQQY